MRFRHSGADAELLDSLLRRVELLERALDHQREETAGLRADVQFLVGELTAILTLLGGRPPGGQSPPTGAAEPGR
jgi:hypothetical protein